MSLTKEDFSLAWLECFPIFGKKNIDTFRDELFKAINRKLSEKEA